MDAIVGLFHAVTALLAKMFEPPLFETLTTGAFGAIFGALGAQMAIIMVQTRQGKIEEVRAINSAESLCFSFVNTFLSVKKQLVNELYQAYVEGRNSYISALSDRSATSSDGKPREVTAHIDFRHLEPIKLPNHLLEKLVFEKIVVHGRAQAAALSYLRVSESLVRTFEVRNDLLEELKSLKSDPATLARMYFGIALDSEAILDERYANVVLAIRKQTDDCIQFLMILSDDLTARGRKIKGFLPEFMSCLPRIATADWSKVEPGLLPDPAQYNDWLSGFHARRSRAEQIWKWVKAIPAKFSSPPDRS